MAEMENIDVAFEWGVRFHIAPKAKFPTGTVLLLWRVESDDEPCCVPVNVNEPWPNDIEPDWIYKITACVARDRKHTAQGHRLHQKAQAMDFNCGSHRHVHA